MSHVADSMPRFPPKRDFDNKQNWPRFKYEGCNRHQALVNFVEWRSCSMKTRALYRLPVYNTSVAFLGRSRINASYISFLHLSYMSITRILSSSRTEV